MGLSVRGSNSLCTLGRWRNTGITGNLELNISLSLDVKIPTDTALSIRLESSFLKAQWGHPLIYSKWQYRIVAVTQ